MKIDITIKDASVEEAAQILANIAKPGSQSITIQSGLSVKTIEVPNVNTSEDDEEESVANVAGEVDSQGLPWDARIHSSNKKKSATTGAWVRRRNVAELTYNNVVAELSAGLLNAAPVAVPQPVFDPAQFNQVVQAVPAHVSAPVYAAPVQAEPVYVAPVAEVAPVVAQPVAQVQTAATQATPTIADLFGKIQQLLTVGQADQAYLNSITHRLSVQYQVQVNNFNDIAARPDMIASALQLIAIDGK